MRPVKEILTIKSIGERKNHRGAVSSLDDY